MSTKTRRLLRVCLFRLPQTFAATRSSGGTPQLTASGASGESYPSMHQRATLLRYEAGEYMC